MYCCACWGAGREEGRVKEFLNKMPSVRIYSDSKLSHSSPGVGLFLGMIPLWLLGNTLITEISDGNWFSYLSPEINSLFEIGINFVPKSCGGCVCVSSLPPWYPVGSAALPPVRKSGFWGMETKHVLVNKRRNRPQFYIIHCTINSEIWTVSDWGFKVRGCNGDILIWSFPGFWGRIAEGSCWCLLLPLAVVSARCRHNSKQDICCQ